MKFRKKPVVIEAIQFDGGNAGEIAAAYETDSLSVAWQGRELIVTTLEGEMRADVGDWIIRGIKGELYPCKPDIFAATYEPAGV
jgi:hypothetical protein